MSYRVKHAALPLISAGLFAFTLAGCDSTGSYRVASVGQQGLTGAAGPQGANGTAGNDGSGGSSGSNGTAGAGAGAGTAVASGGLVGGGGVAGTGLLANTGDPSHGAGSGVLVASGTTASNLAQRGAPLAQRADASTPGGLTLTGRVVRTADNSGQALVQAGNGRQYLVDGVSAAPGSLVTFEANDPRAIGGAGDRPLIAGTAVSATTQQRGDALTAGAANRDQPATISSPTTGTVTPGTATPVLPGTNVLPPVTGGPVIAVPQPH